MTELVKSIVEMLAKMLTAKKQVAAQWGDK